MGGKVISSDVLNLSWIDISMLIEVFVEEKDEIVVMHHFRAYVENDEISAIQIKNIL